MITDSLGRKADYLRLSVTDRCNCRCLYCMGPEEVPDGELLSLEQLLEIGRAAVACGVRKIRLTGGEPLTRPDILELCRGLNALPELKELCLTTNALLLPALAAPLREVGVQRLNLSLDTLRPERYAAITRLGRLEDALAGIRAAEEAGFSPLKLNVVLLGGFNTDEIPDFVALTREHPWEVRFIELMPMGPCAHWKKSCFVPGQTVLDLIPELEPVESAGVARRWRLPGAPGTVGLISPLSHAFCETCNRLRITADGRLKTCLHSREETDLRGLRGAALEETIRRALAAKPAGHRLTETGSQTARTMNRIGG